MTTATILGLYLIVLSLIHLILWQRQQSKIEDGVGFNDAIQRWRVVFAMVVYGALASPYPLALFGYHVFLMGRGETTREYLHGHKFVRSERHRPFSQQNVLKNFIVVLCRPKPPTWVSLIPTFPNVEGSGRTRSEGLINTNYKQVCAIERPISTRRPALREAKSRKR